MCIKQLERLTSTDEVSNWADLNTHLPQVARLVKQYDRGILDTNDFTKQARMLREDLTHQGLDVYETDAARTHARCVALMTGTD